VENKEMLRPEAWLSGATCPALLGLMSALRPGWRLNQQALRWTVSHMSEEDKKRKYICCRNETAFPVFTRFYWRTAVLYGDPAWEARARQVVDPLYDQRMRTRKLKDGRAELTFTVTMRRASRPSRPAAFFLETPAGPHVEVKEGPANLLVADNFALLPFWKAGGPAPEVGKEYKAVVVALAACAMGAARDEQGRASVPAAGPRGRVGPDVPLSDAERKGIARLITVEGRTAAAVQAVCDRAAREGIRVVFLPAGEYLFEKAVRVPGGLTLLGEGAKHERYSLGKAENVAIEGELVPKTEAKRPAPPPLPLLVPMDAQGKLGISKRKPAPKPQSTTKPLDGANVIGNGGAENEGGPR